MTWDTFSVSWLDYSAARVEVGGKPAIMGVGLDITEAKERELALEAFAQVNVALRRSEDLREMMEAALEATLKALEAPVGSILLYDAETGRLEEATSRGWLKEIPTPGTLPEEALRAVGQAIVASLDLDPTLEVLFNQVMRLPLDAAALFLYNSREKTLELRGLRAYEWLSGIPFLKKALEIPYCHHERWDGSGYPRGLKGLEIPLSARIFAVVDVYDALTSDRPYRKAWPREKALAYIQEQAGKQFDPEVVEAFLRLVAGEEPPLP
ncbi:hypothetical protein TNMX_11655 [Thermus sp. NMX2.A1]|nr:hypothetical protein TNMX_11655 [Thermus sp. NMX2.A1]